MAMMWLIPDGTGTEYQGRDADAQDAGKAALKSMLLKYMLPARTGLSTVQGVWLPEWFYITVMMVLS